MRNAILIMLVAVMGISLATIGINMIVDEDMPATESASDILLQESSVNTEGKYLLKTYEGKLAMFTQDLVVPDMVFDVYVKYLPEYDQEQLERGIRIDDYSELTARIEDYIS